MFVDLVKSSCFISKKDAEFNVNAIKEFSLNFWKLPKGIKGVSLDGAFGLGLQLDFKTE